MIAGLVLAGGKSTRFGSEKAVAALIQNTVSVDWWSRSTPSRVRPPTIHTPSTMMPVSGNHSAWSA